MSEQFERIKLSLIDEDVKNHRLVTDSASDTQLLESIKANGVQQPIKVVKKENGRYTLVFGFRRKAQADRAGLMEIPAMVVEHMTSGEIRTLQAIENLERKELHPLEEAEFCQELADTLKDQLVKTDETALAEAVAARVGRSLKWVENRLALARLSDRVKASFLDGDIHLQHANLIARLASHDAQEEVLGEVAAHVPPYHGKGASPELKLPPSTIAHCRNLVDARLRDLSDVPWLLDKAFDGKVACTECPHNSANRLELFDGDQPKRPQCLDASCFQEKVKFTGRAVQRATNTLVKSENKPTPANAKKAIEEREVEFVEPKAVAEAAKRRADPKEKTVSEKRGEDAWEKRVKVQNEFRSRYQHWAKDIRDKLEKEIPGDHDVEGMAIIGLVCFSELADDADPDSTDSKEQKAALRTLKKVLHLAADRDIECRLQEASKLLAPHLRDRLYAGFGNPIHDFYPMLDEVAPIFGIEIITPPPTIESVRDELYPPAEKKTGARKKKPKSKSKAAAGQ